MNDAEELIATLEHEMDKKGYRLTERDKTKLSIILTDMMAVKTIARELGRRTSEAKAKSSAANGRKGGRPRKV